jgi:hypothetical protein
MSEGRMSLGENIQGLFRNPEETFRNIHKDKLIPGTLIVLFSALLAGWSERLYLSKIPASIFLSRLPFNPAGSEALKSRILNLSTITSFLGILVVWILSTLIMHVIATITTGEGDLQGLYAKTGFASTILVIHQIIRLVDASFIPSSTALILFTQGQTGLQMALLDIFPLFRIVYLILAGLALSVNYGTSRVKGLTISLLSHMIYLIIPLLVMG